MMRLSGYSLRLSLPLLRLMLVGLASLFLVPMAVGEEIPDQADPSPQPFLLGGIQTHELDHERWAAALHRSGMNAVQVTVYAHQGPWNTSKLWYAEEEPAVLAEIRAARRNGLQVVLIMRVALDHNEPANRHLWHGLVYPESESDTRQWFRTYRELTVQWARIAEREGVEVFGIGSEMNALAATIPVDEIPGLPEYYLDDASQERLRALVGRSESLFSEEVRVSMGAGDFSSLDDFLVQRNEAERSWARPYTFAGAEHRVSLMNQRRRLLDAEWRQVVDEVRQVYSGRLTMAANFDNYHEVSFWDALDFIGINAYFPLRKTLETPLDLGGLAESWREVFRDIDSFKKTHELSQDVIFTELGYTRRRGVTVAPWSSKGFIPMWDPEGDLEKDRAFFWSAQPIEPAERALALEALHRVWQEGDTGLAGVLYWKLSSRLDLQRFEPFMLFLGRRAEDPLFDALARFSEGIRPLSPPETGGGVAPNAVEAILRGEARALQDLGPEALRSSPPEEPLLHLAVRLGRSEIVRWLVDSGASVTERDRAGRLPIHWACFQEDPDLVPLLVPPAKEDWLDGDGENPLMKCARLDNEPVARPLLRARKEQVLLSNPRGQTALHLAADLASPELIDALIDAGADLKAVDEHGMTALHLGARRGELAPVEVLARRGKGIPNREKNRPTHEAAIHGWSDVFELLYEPAQALETNVYGQSLLHLAAHGGNLEILELLLEQHPDVDLVDDDGFTPLAFATRNGRVEAARLLAARGASLERRNKKGLAPLHLAAASYEPRLIQHFALLEVDLDLPDGQGNTALHHAAGWGYVENLRLLLSAGATVDPLNRGGETPLDLAEASQRHRAVQLLEQAAKPKAGSPVGASARPGADQR